MILADWEIEWAAKNLGMIDPYVAETKEEGVISYGVSSYGYDIRLGTKFKVFNDPSKTFAKVIDPKKMNWHAGFTNFDRAVYVEMNGCCDPVEIPANSFCLAESFETIKVPRDVLCVCLGKSTYARCGVIVNVTPLEPEWEGKITIEISNTTPLPALIYPLEGILQILFFHNLTTLAGMGKREHLPICAVSYKDKRGKYQGQTGLTMPTVKTPAGVVSDPDK